MRPDDLLDAMEKISQDYIAEAKPFSDDAAESQTEKRFSAEGHASQEIVMHGRKSADSRNGKGSFMKKHSLIQRMTAGAAAVAACAVCVGGGWYVLNQLEQQKAEENSSEIVSEIVEDSETEPQIAATNFLGGQGEIRVLNNYSDNFRKMILCDDTRWYFQNGTKYADRSDAEVSEYYPVSAEAGAIAENLLHDGSRFYVADGMQIYQLEQDGSRSETPFFTMDTALLPEQLTEDKLCFSRILKLDDNTFIISVQRGEEQNTPVRAYAQWMYYRTVYSYIYYADSGKTDPIDESNGRKFLPCGDGSFLAIHTATNADGTTSDDSIIRIWPDGSHEQEECTHFDGPRNSVLDWELNGETLYICLQYDKGEYDMQTDLSALDLQSKDLRILQSNVVNEQENMQSCFCVGDEMFVLKQSYLALTEEEKETARCGIYRADADLNLQDPVFMLDPEAQYPEDVRKRLEHSYSMISIGNISADDHYFMMQIGGNQFALLDRETGNVQYFLVRSVPEENVTEAASLSVDESRYTVLDPGFTGTNFLGGTGSLHIPKNGSELYWFDDDNYYLGSSYFPRSGNQEENLIPTYVEEPINAKEQYVVGRIMNDGERLYVQQNGAINLIDSSGELTPIFQLEDVGLNRNRRVSSVFHIGDAYCFCGSETVKEDPNPDHWDIYSFYVWTDRDGKYLGGQTNMPYIGQFFGSYSGDTCTSVYYFSYESGTNLWLTPPDSGDESEMKISLPNLEFTWSCRCYDDKVYYSDKDGNYVCYDPVSSEEKVLMDAATLKQKGIDIDLGGGLSEDKYFYCMSVEKFDGGRKMACINRIDFETGSTERLLTIDAAAVLDNMIGMDHGKIIIDLIDCRGIFDPQTRELFRLD
ncbi:MAG: hypothetical protein IJL32_13265 [Oscillospiraceae bacterium]|nr:hypothetical protein [Oscillospiraceae bacterium]